MATRPKILSKIKYIIGLCHKKRLMLFLLKPERNNRQKASAVDSTKGNAEKRLYFHSTIEMKQPHTMTEPQ